MALTSVRDVLFWVISPLNLVGLRRNARTASTNCGSISTAKIQQQPLAVLLFMSKLRNIVFIMIAVLAPLASGSAQAPPAQLAWHPWSASVFAQARSENKFVLLDLEAVWCHWCHVMDDVTYRDPAVVQLLNQRYLLVNVDQDARPDISSRYQDYGW